MTGAARVAFVFLLAAGLSVLAAPAESQRITVQVNAGASVGNYSFTDAGLELVPGPSFGALAALDVTERVSVYAGYTRSDFGCEEGFCIDQDVSMTSQGPVVGALLSAGPAWARAGLGLQWLEIRSTGAATSSSDPGAGFDLGAGVEFPVGGRLLVRPGLAYRRHGASTDGSDEHAAVLAAEIGVAMRVGADR